MATKLPKYVIWNGNTKAVEDFPSRKAQKMAFYPEYGDRIGRIVWEPLKKKRKGKR